MIDDFIERRHARVKVSYEVPELEEILKETYGVIVYQEQVMQIASELAGFSLGEADLLRRAMGKKKKSVMEAQRKKFLDGAKERQIDASKAKRIFELMEQFAGYGFNKSHSTAYALLAYQTGYLKARYPVQFMAALLTSEMSNTDKVVQYLAEAKDMGIQVLPPDINSSQVNFVGCGEEQIRFGLAAVKNAGESAIRSIIAEREKKGRFSGFFEFCESIDPRQVNKRVLEALIKAGTFDGIFSKRKSLFEILERAIEHAQKAHRDRLSGQGALFGAPSEAVNDQIAQEVPDQGEWGDREKWAYEKETLGFYLSGHPLQKYKNELKCFSHQSTSDIGEETSGQDVSIGGVITAVRMLQTRKGDTMAVFQLEDMQGTVEVLLWPNSLEKYRRHLDSEYPVLVRGRCDVDARGEIKILCSEILDLTSVWKEGVQKARIRIPVTTLEDSRVERFESVMRKYPGGCTVEFELFERKNYSIHLIPNQKIRVSPVPSFVEEVENLFGEKSCILEIPR
jgi:DNA polymerase-3 subunit alpha